MSDREVRKKHLKVLERLFNQKDYRLLSKEEFEALAFAISSIKTDLKYDLMYENDEDIKPIYYYDCSNAILKLWMENIVTDGEYGRIMNKLNAKHRERKNTEQGKEKKNEDK